MSKADKPVDVRSALLYGREQLKDHTHNAASESRRLLSFVIKKPASWLIAWPESTLESEQNNTFLRHIERRRRGEPLAYITGERDFWSLTLRVSKETLIPRADTEVLVEAALKLIEENHYSSLLDLGTGTGAIALAIASEYPKVNITATDFSEGALKIAQQNRKSTGLQNVSFLQSDWFASLPKQRYDLIVSNPPYIAENDEHLNDVALKYEPLTALTSGEDGLDDIRHIIIKARDCLSKHGHLVLEHGYNQSESVKSLFIESGYSHVQSLRDYGGQIRVTFARR